MEHPLLVEPLKSRGHGYSLLEAILSSFLLVCAFFMVSKLFHTGLQYAAKVETRTEAIQVAEQRMGELRRWAKGTSNWTGFPNGPVTGYGLYTVSTTLENITLYCPSTELEKGFGSNARELSKVAKRANVQVTWGDAGRYVLTGLITKGTPGWRESIDDRHLDEIVITGTFPNPVRDQHVILTAKGYDINDDVIPGLFFHWSVEPVFDGNRPGVGRIELVNRDGSKVEFTNQIRRRDIINQPWTRGDGRCRVVCYALYNGTERAARSEPIELDF